MNKKNHSKMTHWFLSFVFCWRNVTWQLIVLRTARDITSQIGRTVFITGANTGLGFARWVSHAHARRNVFFLKKDFFVVAQPQRTTFCASWRSCDHWLSFDWQGCKSREKVETNSWQKWRREWASRGAVCFSFFFSFFFRCSKLY